MRTFTGLDYEVKRRKTSRYWEEPRFTGDILSLDCAYCDFQIRKKNVAQPRRSKSGLGRYNRMRGKMVTHLHENHRDEMLQSWDAEKRKSAIRLFEC